MFRLKTAARASTTQLLFLQLRKHTTLLAMFAFYDLLHPIFRLILLFYVFWCMLYIIVIFSYHMIHCKYANIHRILFSIYLNEQPLHYCKCEYL